MATENKSTNKGFITDQSGNYLLPITRAELVLDSNGKIAFHSDQFLAEEGLPGLVTAAERAMISRIGGDGDLSLTDVYNKLDYINAGLIIGGKQLKFFTDSNATPVFISPDTDSTIQLTVSDDQHINIGLTALSTGTNTITNTILRNITVDKYGRVTAVSGSNLVDDDIPETLSNKKLVNATTETVGTAKNSIVNKQYVDEKFDSVSGIATGALTFGGVLPTRESATAVKNKENYYYKVTGSFELQSSEIYTGTQTAHDGTISVKLGDTLIIKGGQFVYIPSGDEKQTSISVSNGAQSLFDKQFGNVSFNFGFPFVVTSSGTDTSGYTATISMPKVSAPIGNSNEGTDGYLSWEDYVAFKSYSTELSTTYTAGTITSETEGSYKIGTLTIAGTNYNIYGVNTDTDTKYSLDLGTVKYNDVDCAALKFTGTDSSSKSYYFYGTNGITVTKDASGFTFKSINNVDTNSTKYLSITNNHQFAIKIGSVSGETVSDGLTDYLEFNTLRNAFHAHQLAVVSSTTSFKVIDNSLSISVDDSDTTTYAYGSKAMKAAITYA